MNNTNCPDTSQNPASLIPTLKKGVIGDKIAERREERALFPANLFTMPEQMTAYPLIGYYVESTHIYNIFSPEMNPDPERTSVLGYVLPTCVLNKLGDEIEKRLHPLEKMVSSAQSPGERFASALAVNVTSSGHVYTEQALKEALGGYYDLVPEEWWVSEFLPALNGVSSKNTLLGERMPDGKVRLVRVDAMVEVKKESYSLRLDVFSRNTGILESDIMLQKGAILIGCGSVGSLVAVELAKAGVGRFMLIDSDVFAYHNICRHQCGIYDVGKQKVDAVAERILQINPHAEVIKCASLIQDVDKALLADFCKTDAIFIGGADNHGGNLYACQRATEYDSAFISIGCWERACAGAIFYYIPPNMPDYGDYLEVAGFAGAEEVVQNRHFYTTEEDLAKVSFEPGISVDINFVTVVAVKLIIDILNRNQDGHTPRLLPYLTQFTLVCNTNDPRIGGEAVEIFSYPLQVTTSIQVPYASKDSAE